MRFIKHLKPALQLPGLFGRYGLNFEIRITEDMHYDVGDPVQQMDFIKITGLSSNRFNNHNDAAMIAGRYNLETGSWEFVPYYHFRMERRDVEFRNVVGSFNGHFKSSEILTAKVGDVIKGSISLHSGDWIIKASHNGERIYWSAIHKLSKPTSKVFRIMGWHGGDAKKQPNRSYCFDMDLY